MKQDSLNNIVSNLTNSVSKNSNVQFKSVVKMLQDVLLDNFDLIIEANKIDLSNNNGFLIQKEEITKIFNVDMNYCFDKVIDENGSRKQIKNVGNILILFDGNPYVLIELIIKGILFNNSLLFVYNGFMFGVNNLIVNFIKDILLIYGLSRNQVSIYVCEDNSEVENFKSNFDFVILNEEIKCLNIDSFYEEILTN